MHALILWCVFAPDIRDLGSDRFEVRQSAHRRLESWGWLCWPLLDRSWPDPEVQHRARQICAPHLSPPARPTLTAFPPLGHCKPWTLHREIGKQRVLVAVEVRDWLFKRYGSEDTCWSDYPGRVVRAEALRRPTVAAYRWLRRAGVPRCVMDPVIRWAQRREDRWKPE